MNRNHPQTLLEAIEFFSNEEDCVAYLAKLRWDLGQPVCPRCGSTKCTGLRTRKLYQCLEKGCNKQFSIKTGTAFEKSPISLTKWLPCLWLVANSKTGISSHELARNLGVTQKTAWFMLHRIRETMKEKTDQTLQGIVEVDETWIGGRAWWMSKGRKLKAGIVSGGRISANKTLVFGMIQRGGTVVAKVVNDTKRKSLIPHIEKHIERGSIVFSDSLMSYRTLDKLYTHEMVDHNHNEFVRGYAHTNSIENFWGILKRSVRGTYINITHRHTDNYVAESVFRFNNRKGSDASRCLKLAERIFGVRLTYKELKGRKDDRTYGKGKWQRAGYDFSKGRQRRV